MLWQVPEDRVLPSKAKRVVQLPQGQGPGNEPFEGHCGLVQKMIRGRWKDMWMCPRNWSYGLVLSGDWLYLKTRDKLMEVKIRMWWQKCWKPWCYIVTYADFHAKSVKWIYSIYVSIKCARSSFIDISNNIFRIQVFQFIVWIIFVRSDRSSC